MVEAARAIIDALPPRPDSVTRGQVTELIYFVVASPDLKLPTYRETADDVVLAWLRHPPATDAILGPTGGSSAGRTSNG